MGFELVGLHKNWQILQKVGPSLVHKASQMPTDVKI